MFSSSSRAAKVRRRLILHIGTHKTGTTSLQVSFGARSTQLRESGVLVPKAGRGAALTVGGHHSIAHQFLIDERDPQHEFSDLLDELRASDADLAVVSSENFECLHRSPQALHEMARGFASIGYEVTVVLYVRDQASYAESLYAETFQHDSFLGIDSFLDRMIGEGVFTHNAHWQYAFDYRQIAEGFASVYGCDHVIVRPFRDDEMPSALEEDFWNAIGYPAAIARDRSEIAIKTNTRMTFREALHKLFANARAKPAHATHPDVLLAKTGLATAAFLDEPFAILEAGDLARISQRFAAANEALARRYGVRIVSELRRPYESPQRRLFRAAAADWNLA